jgi:hypothetical protein
MATVAGKKLPIESASVAQTYNTAAKLGWLVIKPARGDLVCYDFDGDGQFDDHIGLVVRVVAIGPVLTLETVEGNTSSGNAGSQANGDGVFLRRRVISASKVAFVRIPGEVAGPVEKIAPDPEAHGESKHDAPFVTPPVPAGAAPETLSEHGRGAH